MAILFLLTTVTKAQPVVADGVSVAKSGIYVDVDSLRTVALSEVVVYAEKYKYSKKNNPALHLLERLRKEAEKSNPRNKEFYSYDKYEKITLGINDYSPEKLGVSDKMFMQQYVDTAPFTGKKILNLSVREKLSTKINSLSPKRSKEITSAISNFGIDEAFNQQNIQVVLEDVLREADIYSNDITIMQNKFVSPLSKIADDFYKFEITDTVTVDNLECVQLSFVPKNPASFGFNGNIYVAQYDTAPYIKRISMRTPKDINLNYVDNIFIFQNFDLDSTGCRRKTIDDMSLELQVMPATPVFYGRRVDLYDNFSYNPREDLEIYYKKQGRFFETEDARNRYDDFWNQQRKIPLTRAEYALKNMMPGLRKVKVMWWIEKLLQVLETGYIPTGEKSKVDIGPINTLISYDHLEGVRFRLGGMTTANLNPHLFLRGYGAYGLRDRKWKYMGEVEYSFTKKQRHAREWPANYISIYHCYDVDYPGQHYLHTNPDNFLLSLKRKGMYPELYSRHSRIAYTLELNNNLSFHAQLNHEQLESTRYLGFIKADGTQERKMRSAWLSLAIRYAPGEKFIQGRSGRVPVNRDSPVFYIRHEYGFKNLLGADFTLNRTEFSFSKRFWFSAFGYLNSLIKAGRVWSEVPFTALLWANANMSYTIQPESYSLMNPLEFASDNYISVDLNYFANGALFNLIPGVKKLKLREVVTFKSFYGSLTKKNNPFYNDKLPLFPAGYNTTTYGKVPYIEVGIGIDNILTFLRIDYVWRVTHRNLPGIDKSGLRASFHFSF